MAKADRSPAVVKRGPTCECGTPVGSAGALCERCQRRQRRQARRDEWAQDQAKGPWVLRFDPRPWQTAAIAAWVKANRRGVVEAATGTGKTAVALAAAEHLHGDVGDRLRMVIVVPSIPLARQWRREVERNLGIFPSWIGEHHSAAQVEWHSDHRVLITVINSARERLAPALSAWRGQGGKTLLVVDECHRAGSEFNARIFNGDYDYALGLSATPERSDRGHEEYVYEGIGKPVYRYPLLNALDDGVLAPLRSINLYVDFTTSESGTWWELGERLGDAFRYLFQRYPALEMASSDKLFKEIGRLARLKDPNALRIQKLLADRRELLAGAAERRRCLHAVLAWASRTGMRGLVFHETIAAAEECHQHLVHDVGIRARLDHSNLRPADRQLASDDFRRGTSPILVAVRSLDEGIDVPDASIAVIAAGSRSRRQRIQRLGRILRRSEAKQSIALSILVRGTPEESAVGGRDDELLGRSRVEHYRWPGVPVSDVIRGNGPRYTPARPAYTFEDLVTMMEIGGWEPAMAGKQVPKATTPSAEAGGYSTHEVYFSPNAWHPVESVRDGIGVPPADFDELRRDIRRVFKGSLDPARVSDASIMHGSEIEAVRRQWRTELQRRADAGSRTRGRYR